VTRQDQSSWSGLTSRGGVRFLPKVDVNITKQSKLIKVGMMIHVAHILGGVWFSSINGKVNGIILQC
jgi:hypothetical protein